MAQSWLEYLQSIAPEPPQTPAEVFEHYEKGLSARHGFWGPVDSGVDWCEHNYVITPLIAEFFNTMSSLPIFIWAVVGAIFTYRHASKELTFQFCFFGLGVVGIGSTLFHASLRRYFQLLDEIPMLLAAMSMLYTVLEIHRDQSINTLRDINWSLLLSLSLVTFFVVYLYVESGYWLVFLGFYALQIFSGIGVCLLYLPKQSLSFRLFLTAVITYFIAWLLWLTDLYLCARVQALQLHSFWHIGAGYGSYLAILVLLVERMRFLSERRKKKIVSGDAGLHLSGFLVPYYKSDVEVHID